MEKIESFKVNHKLLRPGIYVSRVDTVGKNYVTTFDIRCKTPNTGDAMSVEAMHTIEHLAATYFRNLDNWKTKVLYVGPMGCCTGFYLLLAGKYPLYSPEHKSVIKMVIDMFRFINDFKGDIPGVSEIECGNYKLHSLKGAKTIAADMLVMYDDLGILEYEYPSENIEDERNRFIREEIYIRKPIDRENAYKARQNGYIEPSVGLFGKIDKTKEERAEIMSNSFKRYVTDDVSCFEVYGNDDIELNNDVSVPLF